MKRHHFLVGSWAAVLVVAGCKAERATSGDAGDRAATRSETSTNDRVDRVGPRSSDDIDAASGVGSTDGPEHRREELVDGPRHHEGTRAEAAAALRALEGAVREGAKDATNAWAMAHGLVAFGPDLIASDGRPVARVLVTDFLELENREARARFPRVSKEGKPVEPHRMLIAKTMLEMGIPAATIFRLPQGEEIDLRRIVDDGVGSMSFPADETNFRRIAWGLTAILLAHDIDDTVVLEDGPRRVRELVLAALDELERLQSFLIEPMRAGRPDTVRKRKQGIFAHTCGGTHLVQAVALGGAKMADPTVTRRVREQLELLLFRFDVERRIYAQLIEEQPRFAPVLLVQELKFFGHILETFALARDWGVFSPDDDQLRQIRWIVGDLVRTVRALSGAYQGLPRLEQASPETYLDLIGDGCHAIRGLRRALVAFFPP